MFGVESTVYCMHAVVKVQCCVYVVGEHSTMCMLLRVQYYVYAVESSVLSVCC